MHSCECNVCISIYLMLFKLLFCEYRLYANCTKINFFNGLLKFLLLSAEMERK